MGLDPVREVSMEKSTYAPETLDDEEKLRLKYIRASNIALCYLYDSWHIHDYEKFLASQVVGVTAAAEEAPNGIRYSLDDIKGLESKEYTKEEALDILKTRSKYTTITNWDEVPPKRLLMSGDKMDFIFTGEEYRFDMEVREVAFTYIKTLPYDRIFLQVYKKELNDETGQYEFVHVAKTAYYYYSASRYIMRYCNIFDENGDELIDQTNIDEYNVDLNAKEV
jgi:hypothetical protein